LPNHKSCAKRMKQAKVHRLRNRAFTSRLRTAVKELRTETNKDAASQKYLSVSSLLDQAANLNLIHRKNADRNKSRLAHFIQKLA